MAKCKERPKETPKMRINHKEMSPCL